MENGEEGGAIMQTLGVVAVLMALPALAAPAFGQSAPTGYHDLKWGATQEEVLRAFPNTECLKERTELSDWTCTLFDEQVNEVSVTVTLYGYNTGRVLGMTGFTLSFDSDDARLLAETFASRYGRWNRRVETEFLTKSEKPFPSVKWAWHLPDVEIRMEQDKGTLGNGQATVMWHPGLEELLAREREWKPEAGKGP